MTRDSAGEALLRRMARQLDHRGPDGEGVAVENGVGLVHRRLGGGADPAEQPLRSADGRYLIAFNGTLYNQPELREQLVGLGDRLTTGTDAEVVLAAWVRWGAAAFDRCNGMFALAIADSYSGEVVLARDQFGIKPLYLAADGSGRVGFGSEIRAVLAAAVVPRRPDDLTIYRYLCFQVHDDSERTFFDRVTRLLPGELAVISPDGKVRRRRYTRLYHELDWLAATPRPYDRTAREQVRAGLREAVRQRLAGDRPVGTLLSGGLDSAAVIALVDRLLADGDPYAAAAGPVQRSVTALPVGAAPGRGRCVDAVAAGCADRLRLDRVYPDAGHLLTDLVDFARTQEEPVISAGAYLQYCLFRQASQQVQVVLDGQGAAELLGGYLPYLLVNLRQLHRVRGPLPAGVELLRSADLLCRLGRRQLAGQLRRRGTQPAAGLLTREFAAASAGQRFGVVSDDLKRRLAADVFRHSLPALLRYADRNSMRFSVEIRLPYLDPQLLRLLWGLESEAIIKGGWTQRALRDATADLLPARVRRGREPVGAGAPESAWLRRLRGFVHDVFRSESFGNRPYFDQPAVTAAFESYLAGRSSAETSLFWRFFNVEIWLAELVDRDPVRPPVTTLVEHYRQPLAEPAPAAAPESAAETGPVGQPPPAPPRLAPLPVPAKPDWQPNPGRQLVTDDGRWARFPLQVALVRIGDDLPGLAAWRVGKFFDALAAAPPEVSNLVSEGRWYLYLSEKAVAVAQGRSYFSWQIQPAWWARRLCRYVVRTPYGIGLGDPTSMQLAINEVGLLRILVASAVSVAGKLVGRRGLFYRVTGSEVAAIDGPTWYSVYPANVAAKLAPADPDRVAEQVSTAIRELLPEPVGGRYGGAVVIDANDFGRTVLGHDTGLPVALLADAFDDNPLGQGREQTPYGVVFAIGTGPAPQRLELAAESPPEPVAEQPPEPVAEQPPEPDQRRSSLLRTSVSTSSTSDTRNNLASPK